MNARIARVLVALTIATGAATSVAAPVVGATRIAIAPSFLRLAAAAGGSGTVTIAVHNTGDEPFTIENASGYTTDFAPAPSADALIPAVPAAPAVPVYRLQPHGGGNAGG